MSKVTKIVTRVNLQNIEVKYASNLWSNILKPATAADCDRDLVSSGKQMATGASLFIVRMFAVLGKYKVGLQYKTLKRIQISDKVTVSINRPVCGYSETITEEVSIHFCLKQPHVVLIVLFWMTVKIPVSTAA